MILALSLAFARLKAKSEGLELFQYINKIFQIPNSSSLPSSQLDGQEPSAGRWISNSKTYFQRHQRLERTPDIRINQRQISINLRRWSFRNSKLFPKSRILVWLWVWDRNFMKNLGNFWRKKFGKENVVLGDEAGFPRLFRTMKKRLKSWRN